MKVDIAVATVRLEWSRGVDLIPEEKKTAARKLLTAKC